MDGCGLVLGALGLGALSILVLTRVGRIGQRTGALERRVDELLARIAALEGGALPAAGGAETAPAAPEPAAVATPEPSAAVPPAGSPAARPGPVWAARPEAIAGTGAGETVEAPPAIVPVATPVPPPPAGALTVPPSSPAAAPGPPPPSLEERLGARLPVWIGSIALALAGAFLVKYSLDQGWLGPRVRVLLAIAFAFALVAAGERLRRSSASIAQGVTAAGVAVLFAALLAAVHLYGLITPWAGFLLLAAATAGAVGLALRHGPMVALIGLLGGLFVPHLVALGDPRPYHLFTYLLLLQIGVLVVSRRRGWMGMGVLAVAGGLGWALLWIAGLLGGTGSRGAALFLLASAATSVLLGASSRGGGEPRRWPSALLPGLGTGGSLILLAILVLSRGFAVEEWVYLGVLVAGLLLLGRLEERYFPLAPVAAGAVGVLVGAWSAVLAEPQLPRFLAVTVALGALVALGSYAALWGAPRPSRWALLSTAAATVAPLVAFAGAGRVGAPLPRGAVCLGVAALLAVAALPLARARRRSGGGDGDDALSPFAVGVAILVPLAAWFELSGGALTVAWALEVPVVVGLARRWRLEPLWGPAVPLATLAVARLAFRPDLHVPDGGLPVVNLLLLHCGVPAAAFALAAWWGRRDGAPAGTHLHRFAGALVGGAVLLAFLLVTLEVRHAFHGTRWGEAPFGLAEAGWLAVAWVGLALALALVDRLERGPRLTPAAQAVLAVALAGAGMLLLLMVNPLFSHRSVGTLPILDVLLWAYGAPALLLALTAREMARHQSPGLARGARFGALLSLLMLVTLETRKAFQGPYLASSEVGFAEWGGLVVAWLALAALLVAAEGRFPGHDLARFGHAVLVLALLGLLAGPLTAANPLWTHLGVGSLPVVNLLLWVYGAPALLLAWHARAAGRLKRAGLARAAGGAALVLLLVLVTLEVRQAFRGPFLDVPAIGFAEWGGLVVAWLALAALLVAAEGRAPGHDLERFGHAVLVLALLGLLAGPLSAANPLWAHLEVGSLPVVNLLLWVYGAPALLLAWHARAAGRRGRRELARAAASAALLLLFVLVTLEVRQAFRGAILDGLAAGHGERYAYSAAWVALGIGLLVAGIVGPGGRALRLAALAVMTLAVGKVFLYDTAHLTDLYRVLSFLGLGLSLLLLAWLYQRFVFRTPAAPL